MNGNNSDSLSLCPSFRNIDGAKLIGVRKKDGKISILPKPLEIDNDAFAKSLPEGVNAEQAFRFTHTCQERHCKQWTKKGCGVALRAKQHLGRIEDNSEVPECSIRPKCRWYQQEGFNACKMCPYIITDITAAEVKDYIFRSANALKGVER